jgi:hypothetical protein
VIYVSTRGPIALLAIVLAAALIVAGCGGGGSDSTATGSDGDSSASLSKAEFIKEADAICKEGGKQAQSEFAAFLKESKIPEGKEPTDAQWEEIGTQILAPVLQQQVDEIRQLGTPAADEAQIEIFLEGVDKAVEEVEEKPVIAKEPSELLADAHRTIKGYGFKVCGPEK